MRKLILLFSALVLCIGVVFGQGKTISGSVVDENNEPAIGASIQVKGAETVGTISDFDGNFTITLPAGKTHLIVSYVGYSTVEQEAKNGMVVRLSTDAEVLDEVMVVAYGTQTKKSFSGSATVVKGETLEKKNPSEVSKALAGEIAGVQVVSTSGQPGSSATISIRGVGSINSSSAPLYVVDGIPYDGDVSAIDPSDIASTTVLKDATATSLYGSRGSNGVILITTKKGTSGESGKIDIDVKYGGNMRLIPLYETITDPQQFVELVWEGLYNASGGKANVANNQLFSVNNGGLPAAYNRWTTPGNQLINPESGEFFDDIQLKQGYIDEPTTSWQKAIFRNGQKLDATLKISGGSDKTTYYTSFGYLKDEGYYIGSDYSRLQARINVDHQAKKWLKGSMNMSYSYSIYNNPGQGSNMNNGFAYVNECPSIYPVFQRDENGYKVDDPKIQGQKAYDYGDVDVNGNTVGRLYGNGINPAGALQYDKQRTLQHQLSGNGLLEATLYKGLKFTTNFGLQYLSADASELTNNYYGDAAGVGRIAKAVSNGMSFTWNQILSYNPDFGGDHNFSAFVAHESLLIKSSAIQGGKNYIVRPDGLELGNAVEMSYLTSSTATRKMESYFGQARYSYKDKYFVDANLRADGSSRFARGHRWGTFGSIGLAWDMMREDFMQGVDLLRNLKIKASWGELGNAEIGTYLYTNQYSVSNVGGLPAYLLGYIGNPDLTWESSQILNTGVDITLGKVLDAEVVYFHKTTNNMLFDRSVAPSLGYSSYYVNEGEMVNQGVEFQFNVHAVNTNAVKFDVRFNGAWYKNTITKMPTDVTGEPKQMDGSMSLGHSIYEYYTKEWAGVNPETGKAEYYYFYDPNNLKGETFNLYQDAIPSVHQYILDNYGDDPNLNKYLNNPELILTKEKTENYNYASSYYVGKSALPYLQGGVGFDLSFYGVDFSAAFQYSFGGWGYDGAYQLLMHSDRGGSTNWHVDILNRWQEPGDVTDVPRLSNKSDLYANSSSTRFIVSSSYLSLSNVRVGYSFPKKVVEKIKLNNLNLWVSADNLFCLSARQGYIPIASMTGSSSTYQYTPLSTILGGIKISF